MEKNKSTELKLVAGGAKNQAAGQQDEVQRRAEAIANRIVARKLTEAGFTKKGDLAAFKAWREAQQANGQAQADLISRLERENTMLRERFTELEHRQMARDAGVAEPFVAFVAYEAARYAIGDTCFGAALAQYLGQNPQFLATAARAQQPVQQASFEYSKNRQE